MLACCVALCTSATYKGRLVSTFALIKHLNVLTERDVGIGVTVPSCRRRCFTCRRSHDIVVGFVSPLCRGDTLWIRTDKRHGELSEIRIRHQQAIRNIVRILSFLEERVPRDQFCAGCVHISRFQFKRNFKMCYTMMELCNVTRATVYDGIL